MQCFFTMESVFASGGQEHHDLQLSQLKRLYCPDRYVYYENTSKNRKGGLSELQLEHKSVPSYANPDAGVRCHVFLLDLYISKLPKEAVTKDIFYCRQLPSLPTDETKPWYAAVPVGRNVLTKMVATMCAEAGIKGTKSNHSLVHCLMLECQKRLFRVVQVISQQMVCELMRFYNK